MDQLSKQIINLVKTVVIISIAFLIGCASMEYRSDAPKKTPLQPLEEASVVAKRGWSTSVGKGIGQSNVKLLLASEGDLLVAADSNGLVKAIDRLSGKKLWQQQLKMAISAGPTLENKKVIVTGNAMVIALDSANGEILWQTAVMVKLILERTATRLEHRYASLRGSWFAIAIACACQQQVARLCAVMVVLTPLKPAMTVQQHQVMVVTAPAQQNQAGHAQASQALALQYAAMA